ncbi:unnamed protein product [Rotaria magnacalcarata]|uniref:Disease resistance R13L4/SHOC-2-like LRR domain-containing protein n=1 Tax=Rotaria magnacalcarata TaxID=392030 RepID=A0A816RFN3_9BILA|nr:unnamed protein product [Rotaria magnacalcarata]
MANQSLVLLVSAFCLLQIATVVGTNVDDIVGFSNDIETQSKSPDGVNDNTKPNERTTLDCTQFRRDYDILKSFHFLVPVNPPVTTSKTYATMNITNHVIELTIYNESFVPLNVYCLKNLNMLTILNTDFYQYGLDDQTIRPIPSEIGQLSLLHTLTIINCPVGRLPDEIGQLLLLTELTITGSNLKEIPNVIENLSLLQVLRLSNNQLILLPSNISRLSSLEILWLDSNRFTSLPSAMSSLTGLNTLYIQSNPLTSIDELNNLYGLQHLYATSCKIKYLPNNIVSLITLNMAYNNLIDLFGIGSLGRSSGWKNFDFSYNEIDLIPPEIYNIISNMQSFSVKHNNLTHLPNEIYYLQNLNTVSLNIGENLFSLDELNTIKATIVNRLRNVRVTY